MSHRLKTARHRVQTGKNSNFEGGENIDSLQALESHVLTDSLTLCENPLCAERFSEGGMPQSKKRFCNDACLQTASILRRAGKLLENETDERVIEILRGKP
jgi:hypothetical protein